jgi:glutaredoxin
VPERVQLLTREGCHLCVVAAETLTRIAGEEAGLPVELVDVDADPELRAEYGDLVPVVLVDGKELGYWRIEEARLRRALV